MIFLFLMLVLANESQILTNDADCAENEYYGDVLEGQFCCDAVTGGDSVIVGDPVLLDSIAIFEFRGSTAISIEFYIIQNYISE